ncbi:MAG: hypothetical protein V8T36_03085 [Ruthenibacterium lactatiformans]
MHYILEHVMRRAGAEFPGLTTEELARLAGEVATNTCARTCRRRARALPTWWNG